MKIVAVNVCFSPNLGDGIIAECTEHSLKRRIDDAVVVNCDLAGRAEFSRKGGLLRAAVLRAAEFLPERLRHAAFTVLFEKLVKSLMPYYRLRMTGADAAIFGGGQLFADDDLNFPMKVAGAAAAARDFGVPIAIHGVGVGRFWSRTGTELFRAAFDDAGLFWASVRDELSARRWSSHFAGTDILLPRVCVDAGLLASRVYGAAPSRETSAARRIGLCLTRPQTLKLHSDDDRSRGGRTDAKFYRALAKILVSRGHDVVAFTSGAPDDHAFMRKCFRFAPKKVRCAARPLTPSDYAGLIAGCDLVVAHRLHANIVAYSYGIAHVGLSTNRKLDEFFALTERTEFLRKPEQFDPVSVADAVDKALATPIADETHERLLQQAEQDFDVLAEVLKRTVRKGRGPVVKPPVLEVVRNN